MTGSPPCATCHAPEDAHRGDPSDSEAAEVLLALLGCTTGYRVSRGAVAMQRAAKQASPKTLCGRCGQQGHTKEECTC